VDNLWISKSSSFFCKHFQDNLEIDDFYDDCFDITDEDEEEETFEDGEDDVQNDQKEAS